MALETSTPTPHSTGTSLWRASPTLSRADKSKTSLYCVEQESPSPVEFRTSERRERACTTTCRSTTSRSRSPCSISAIFHRILSPSTVSFLYVSALRPRCLSPLRTCFPTSTSPPTPTILWNCSTRKECCCVAILRTSTTWSERQKSPTVVSSSPTARSPQPPASNVEKGTRLKLFVRMF